MNNTITIGQLVLAISIPTAVAMIGVMWSIIASNKLGDRIDRIDGRLDRMNESLYKQVTTLLETIHAVNVRVVKLEERK